MNAFRKTRLQGVDATSNGLLLAAHLGRYQTAIVLWKANYELHFFTYEKPELAGVVGEGFCKWTVTRGRQATAGMSHAERAKYAMQHFFECCDTLGWPRPKMEVLEGEDADYFTYQP